MNTANGVTIANARSIRKATAQKNGENYSNRSISIIMISRDIIKTESIEQSMKEREAPYQDLYENAPNAYFSVAKDGTIIRCNGRSEHLLGRKRNEIIGSPVVELYSETPHGKEKALRIFERFKDGETISGEELQMQKSDGSPVWISLTVNAMRDPAGNIVESRSMAVDITDRIHAEEALAWEVRVNSSIAHLSKDLLNPLLSIADIANIILDHAKSITESESGYISLADPVINYLPNALTIMMDTCLLTEGEKNISFSNGLDKLYPALWEYIRNIRNAFYTNSPENHEAFLCVQECPFIIKNFLSVPVIIDEELLGQIVLANSANGYSYRYLDTVKRLVELYCLALERKRSEENLRASEERFRILAENIPGVIYLCKNDDRWTMLYLNDAIEQLTGYSKDDFLSDRISFVDIYHPDDTNQIFAKVEDALSRHAPFHLVYRIKHKSGEWRWIDEVGVGIYRNGEVRKIEGFLTDITDYKESEIDRAKLEIQLLQAQKMEAIGQLAGGFAHDFNNILTAILGYGKLLDDEIDKNSIQRNYVHHMLASARRGANLIKALLAFSRKKDISPMPVNLNEVVRELEGFLSRIIGKGIELSSVLSDKDLIVVANSGLIEQVLMNLATNARDAMPNGGYLIIRTEMMVIDYTSIREHGYIRPGEYAIVSFHDSGHGMDEETQGRIFEPFFTTKETGRGTGLGLSMVYGIIKQHNGHISVYSEPGKGTTFKIYLPMIESNVEEVKQADTQMIKKETDTILIADDNVKVRTHIKEVLSEFGYRVVEAEDGEDALRVFYDYEDSIDLLIFDIMMPHRNGPEAYTEIKKTHPDTKIIFISGCNTDVLYKEKILEEGLDFVSKPLLPEYFLTKIREVLDK
jgi:PAS domain S-box-containing protein